MPQALQVINPWQLPTLSNCPTELALGQLGNSNVGDLLLG
jgi:hypothetical protein